MLTKRMLKLFIQSRNLKPATVNPSSNRFHRFLSLNALNRSDEKSDGSKQPIAIHQGPRQTINLADLDTDETGTYCPPLASPLPKKSHEHPHRRALDLLGVTGRNDPKTTTNLHFPRHCDILIIGGTFEKKLNNNFYLICYFIISKNYRGCCRMLNCILVKTKGP
jgi:hypothetical protein